MYLGSTKEKECNLFVVALIVEYLPVYQSWEFCVVAAFPVTPEAGVGRGMLDTALWPTQGQQKVKLSFFDG